MRHPAGGGCHPQTHLDADEDFRVPQVSSSRTVGRSGSAVVVGRPGSRPEQDQPRIGLLTGEVGSARDGVPVEAGTRAAPGSRSTPPEGRSALTSEPSGRITPAHPTRLALRPAVRRVPIVPRTRQIRR